MKKERKVFALIFLSLILTSFFINVVVAADANQNAQIAADNLKTSASAIKTFFSTIFGGIGINIPWSTLFLAILLFMIIFDIMKLFFSNLWGGWGAAIASFSVTALSFMLLPDNLLNAIVLQYGAMGAAIVTIIPLIIMVIFTATLRNIFLSRMLWIFYSVYYFFLYIGAISGLSIGVDFTSGGGWYYLAAIFIGIIMIFFIGPIRKLIFKGEISSIEESGMKVAKRGELLHKLQKNELGDSYGTEK